MKIVPRGVMRILRLGGESASCGLRQFRGAHGVCAEHCRMGKEGFTETSGERVLQGVKEEGRGGRESLRKHTSMCTDSLG